MRRILLCVTLSAGCASTAENTSRDLPAGLSPLSDLLVGCGTDGEDQDGVARIHCQGDVMFASRAHHPGTELFFKQDAARLATERGAQLVWDQAIVPTEAHSGLVERARAFAPLSDVASVTLVGATHKMKDDLAEEVWCTSVDVAGDDRCRELIGAALARESSGAPMARTAPPPRAATFLGRSLSLPTTCAVEGSSKDDGTVRCENGTTLMWSAHTQMDDAVLALHALFTGVGEDGEGAPFECALGGEPGRCEARGNAIGGVTYLDGRAVAVCCAGPGALTKDGGCRAVILPR